MAVVNLTPNAIEMICNGEFQEDEVKPVFQVSDVKLLSAGQQNSSERYRMILSDGVHLQLGMLAKQLNYLVHESKLQKGSIVQLSQFVSQMIQNRKIIIIIDLNVILEKCDPIGEPKTYVQGGGTASGVPQARPSMPVHKGQIGSNGCGYWKWIELPPQKQVGSSSTSSSGSSVKGKEAEEVGVPNEKELYTYIKMEKEVTEKVFSSLLSKMEELGFDA